MVSPSVIPPGSRVITACAMALASLLSAGCGGGSETDVAVSGHVTAGQRPLSGAVITFEPMAGTSGPNASSLILNGDYEIKPTAGLHGGTYRVRVSMVPTEIRKTLADQVNEPLPSAKAVIAPAFDHDSELQCELQHGENAHIDFKVQFIK